MVQNVEQRTETEQKMRVEKTTIVGWTSRGFGQMQTIKNEYANDRNSVDQIVYKMDGNQLR